MKNLYVLSRTAWCLAMMFLFSGVINAQSTTLLGKKINIRHAELNESFAVYEIFELDIKKVQTLTQSGNAFDFSLQLDQQVWEVYLEHNDLRSPNYREAAITDKGNKLMPPRPNVTFKGRTGTADTRFTITQDYLIARLVRDDKVYYLEPLSRLIKGLPKNQYVYYEINDILSDPNVECVHNAGKRYASPHPDDPKGTTDPLKMMAECVEVEMATAGDFTMFDKYGSVMAVNDFILNVTNLMQPLYGVFDIDFVIVDQFVVTSLVADPFDPSDTEAFDILDAFRPWAGANFINHDLGQLWTDRDIRGCNDDDNDNDDSTNFGLIGCADAIGDVCGSNRYNLCEDFSNSSNCLRNISAHEIGHVFDGIHSLGPNASVDMMGPNIACTETAFSAANIARMQSHIDSRDCLAACEPCDLDDDAPAITCGFFSMVFDRCPTPLGPNTPNGNWVNVGADGMFNVAAGGSSILTVDLNACVTDATSDFANIDYMLVSSYQNGICPKSIFNEFVLRDECGNVSTGRIITEHIFSENDAPVISVQAMNMTVECDGAGNLVQLNTWLANQGGAVATDACTSINWSNNFTDFSFSCGAGGSTLVTFTVSDACGNSAMTSATFTIEDTEDPIINTIPGSLDQEIILTGDGPCPTDVFGVACYSMSSAITPLSVSIQFPGPGGEIFNFPGPNLADIDENCGLGNVTCSFGDIITTNCERIIEITWVATDACGNDSEPFVQAISLIDGEGPEFDLICQIDEVFTTNDGNVCPADATISLSEGDEIDVFTGWTVGGISIPSLQGCIDDNCADEADFVITVDDITVVDDGTCSRTITVTFIGDDGCGNLSDPFVCNYTFVDNTGPEVSFNGIPDGGTYVIECDLPSSVWDPLTDIGELTITDNCSAIDVAGITEVLTQLYDGPCQGNVLTRWQQVFTVMDICGNTTVYTLFTDIIDTTPPVFELSPEDMTIECDKTAELPEMIAFDSCSEVIYDFTEVRTDGSCPNNYTLTRTWTATDGCGNASSEIQVITVEDTTSPVIEFIDGYINQYSPGEDVHIDCQEYGNISLLIANNAVATDNCSGNTAVEYHLEDLGNFDCAEYGYIGHLVSRWESKDECGNISIATINWYLVDESAPVFQNVPEDVCAGSTLPPVANVQAVDQCDYATLNFSQSEPIDCEGGQYIERTWTAFDPCGNTATATQRITLSGSENGPTISINYPEIGEVNDGDLIQLPIDCSQDLAFSVQELEAAISINAGCGSGDSTIDLTLMDEGDCTENGYFARYRVNITASDPCGNTANFSLIIDFVDGTGPVVTSPAAITINCGDAIPPLMATDACGEINDITFVDEAPIETSCANDPEPYLRTWTVTDACGNATTFLQKITIIDSDGPVFSGIPADACNDLTLDETVTAIDACTGEETEVMFSEEMSDEAGCGQVLTRTWIATDACGNTSRAKQHVFFDDDLAPSINFTNDLLYGLESGDELFLGVGNGFGDPNDPLLFTSADVMVMDNCATLLADVMIDRTISTDCATDGYLARYDYLFTATDPCGNSSTAKLTVFYVDNNAPDFSNTPQDVDVFCSTIPAVANIFISDDYDEDVEVVFNETQTATSEGVLITRTWTATDDCGNTSSFDQEILVVDNDLSATFSYGSVIECNSDDNRLGVTVTGGTAPYSYQWELTSPLEDGYITTDPTGVAVLFTMGYISQTFSVLITDANGCELLASVTIVCDFSGDEGDFLIGQTGNGAIGINAYPNPAKDYLRVESTQLSEKAVQVKLYNLYGQEVLEEQVDSWPQEGYELNTNRLPNGTYLLRITPDGEAPVSKEVVILH